MKTITYILGTTLAIALCLFGFYGLFGLMAGRIDLFFEGGISIIIGVSIIETMSWNERTDNYPEYAITRCWDDEIAGYEYALEYYGRIHETGTKKWAEATAKHYGIKMEFSNATT